MVTGSMLLVIFFAALVLVFGLIIWVKWEPFLALLAGAVVAGLLVGIPMAQLPGFITRGFGNTLGGIGITIGLGVMLGELLFAAGATHRIAESMLKLFGDKRSPLAIALTGWVVSIPVFMDAAFVILIGLVKQLSSRTKISMITMVTALSVGLIATHAVVAPTPGPLVVAENMGINLGLFIMYGVIVTLPAVLVGGWLYGLWIGRNAPAFGSGSKLSEAAAAMQEAQVPTRLPAASLAFGLLALPIGLILLNTIFGVLSKGSGTANFFAFVGEKNMALFISVIAASLLLRSFFKENTNDIYARAIRAGGLIILITGAGGAFGSVIQGSGIGDYLVTTMQGWNMPVILLAFLFSQMLRMAQEIGRASWRGRV